MKWVWTYLFLMCVYSVKGQDAQHGKIVAENVWSAAIDPLQEIYYINKNKQLVKISEIQDREYSYSNLMIDENTYIDVQNSFKIALFKKNVGDFLILDNRLNLTAKSNLFDLGYFGVTALTVSADNKNIWLFDENIQRLIKIDQQFREVYRSDNLTQSLSQSIRPKQIIEKTNKLYLLDNEKGIFVFDNVGNYIKTYPVMQADRIWIINDKLYFSRGGKIWWYNPLLFEEVSQYAIEDFTLADLCKDFILAISPAGVLFQFNWK